LAIAFIEHTMLQRFHDQIKDEQTPAALRSVLGRLCALYGLWTLTNHMAILYQGKRHIKMISEGSCHTEKKTEKMAGEHTALSSQEYD